MSDMFYLNTLPADEEPVPIVTMVPARGSAGNVNETGKVKEEEGKATKSRLHRLLAEADEALDSCVVVADNVDSEDFPIWRDIRNLEDRLMEAEDTADEAGAMQIMKEAMHMRAALDATMEREFGIMGATALDGDGLVTAFEAAKTVTSKPRHGVLGPGERFVVVQHGAKDTLKVPGLPECGVPDSRGASFAAAVEADPGVDVDQVRRWTVAREPAPDRQRTAPLVEAPTYTAPLWDRRKRPGREGDGRSVAGYNGLTHRRQTRYCK